ncbi:MAG TPA: DUF1015 domain-containing protein [Streptosporangiaceae bacterium]|nr:DUF1015 domain-containing protein [Streptosporangiaceae bacterium]
MLAPFRGVRYAADRVSDLAGVTSPPYDVIAHDIEAQLIAADPHNIVRLILPHAAGPPGGGRYDGAARALRQWQDERVLVADPVPGLYVYEQARPAANGDSDGAELLQRGLIGGLGLRPPEDRVILPHEDVMPGPVTGRRELMETTQSNLEPIFLLYDGGRPPGAATQVVEAVAAGDPPLAEALTEDGLRHRLWAVTDPARLAAVAADLAPRQALIADGHHRYAAYRQLQARRRDAGCDAGPWDYGLALLVDSAAYPPRIGAIHRVLPGLTPDKAVDLAKGAFCVTPQPGGSRDLDAALAALDQAAADGPAFLIAGGGGGGGAGSGAAYLLTDPDPVQAEEAMPDGLSATWRGLGYAVLQQLLITRLWGLRDDDRSVQIVHNDAATAIAEAGRSGGTAVICAPMSAAEVYTVAANGERVPRKSTSFGPKPRTGLVIRTFAES